MKYSCVILLKIYLLDNQNANEIPPRLISATLMAAILDHPEADGFVISGKKLFMFQYIKQILLQEFFVI